MSYSNAVLDLSPYFYFPMEVKFNLNPVDIVSDLEFNSVGDYGYEISPRFYSNSINLPDGSYGYIDPSSDFNSSPATFGMWISSDLVEDSIEIFSIHSESQGFGLSYSTITSELTFHNYSGSSSVFSVDLSSPSLVTIEIVPDLVVFGPASDSVEIKINSETIYSVSGFSISGEPEINIGSLNDNEGRGQLNISDFFYLQSTISQYNIENLYSLGYEGYDIFPFTSSSDIIVSDANNTFLQTAWQAYGEVTTKK